MIVNGVEVMYSSVAGAISTIWQNLPDIMGAAFGNTTSIADLATKIEARYLQGLKSCSGPGFFQAVGSGFGAGVSGHTYAPTSGRVFVNQGTIHIHADKNTTPGELFDKAIKAAAMRNLTTQGANHELPWYSSRAIVSPAAPSHP